MLREHAVEAYEAKEHEVTPEILRVVETALSLAADHRPAVGRPSLRDGSPQDRHRSARLRPKRSARRVRKRSVRDLRIAQEQHRRRSDQRRLPRRDRARSAAATGTSCPPATVRTDSAPGEMFRSPFPRAPRDGSRRSRSSSCSARCPAPSRRATTIAHESTTTKSPPSRCSAINRKSGATIFARAAAARNSRNATAPPRSGIGVKRSKTDPGQKSITARLFGVLGPCSPPLNF